MDTEVEIRELKRSKKSKGSWGKWWEQRDSSKVEGEGDNTEKDDRELSENRKVIVQGQDWILPHSPLY